MSVQASRTTPSTRKPSSRQAGRDAVRSKQGAGAGRPPTPVPGRWKPLRNRWYLTGFALILVAAVVIVVMATKGGDNPAPAPAPAAPAASVPPTGSPTDAAQMQELQRASDQRNVTAVTEAVIAGQEALLPIMTDLQGPLPTTDAPATSPSAAEVEAWRVTVAQVAADFDALPSGNSEYNATRNGFALSTHVLESSIRAYAQSVATGEAPGGPLAVLAADLRIQAAEAWSVAGIGLDLLNIDQGGHMHVQLPILPAGDEAPDTDPDH